MNTKRKHVKIEIFWTDVRDIKAILRGVSESIRLNNSIAKVKSADSYANIEITEISETAKKIESEREFTEYIYQSKINEL